MIHCNTLWLSLPIEMFLESGPVEQMGVGGLTGGGAGGGCGQAKIATSSGKTKERTVKIFLNNYHCA